MNIQSLSKDEVLRALLTGEAGLSPAEAASRLHEYGPNVIEKVSRRPLYKKAAAQLTHFLALLLWLAAALCFLSERLKPGEGMYSLGAAIVAVIFINAAFTLAQEYKAERAVEVLRRLLPSRARVVRGGSVVELRAEEVAPGDLVVLSEGDKVPADARLIESSRLKVNNAPLTGEPEARESTALPFDGDLIDSPNIVFAGTLVVGGSGRAVVFSTGMATEFGKIARLTETVEPGPTPLQKEITKTTRVVAAIAAFTGIFFFGLGFFIGRSFWHNVLFAVGIIVANVPEGLLPTVTLSLAMGSQRLARKNALVKDLASVETLGSVTVICTDKTGTLTQNKMVVREVWTPGAGGDMLMTAGRLCNDAELVDGEARGDPTEAAILKYSAERASADTVAARRIREIPFDPDRKRMTTVDEVGGECYAFCKGALETVLPLCEGTLAGGLAGGLDGAARASVTEACSKMMDSGLRVIAFAYRVLPAGDADALGDDAVESGMGFLGLMGLHDPPRPEVPDAVRRCRAAGIRVIMITGDASRTALAVARLTGLATGVPVVVEGHELMGMPDAGLRAVLANEEVIFSRMTPRLKMRVVSVLKDEGERVAVTGDGVNDAPALKKADIGIAMGLSGTDVAREAADMVLMDDNFATIVTAVEEGRNVFGNIRKFITYIFASNIPEIVPYLAYVLLGIPLPLTIMQILAVDLGTDIFPALALGAEKPSPEAMDQPPRGPDEKLLNKSLLVRAYLFLGPIEAAAGLFGFFHVLHLGGWRWGAELPSGSVLYMQATTACLAGIVVSQIGNVFACRSSRESVFRLGIFSNRLVTLGIALELAVAGLVIYTPAGNGLFGTAPIGLDVWLVLLPFGLLILLAEESRKWFVRRPGGAGTATGPSSNNPRCMTT